MDIFRVLLKVEKSFRRRFEIISQTSYHLSVDVNVMGSFLDHEPRFCNSHQQQQTKEQEMKGMKMLVLQNGCFT